MNSLGYYSAITHQVEDNRDLHIRIIIPRRRITMNPGAVIVDTARTKLLK